MLERRWVDFIYPNILLFKIKDQDFLSDSP
jgi:hypothetical protein